MKNNTFMHEWFIMRIALITALLILAGFPISHSQDNSSGGANSGGDMLQLFMTNEQRRLLEAVRQGLLRDDELDRVQEINTARLQEFEELQTEETIELDEFISFDNPVVVERGRSIDLNMGGFIRIGTRNSTFYVNGEFVDASELSESLGIDFNQLSSESKTEVVGVDLVRQQRVVLKPGQTLPTTGAIRENLYVINADDLLNATEIDSGIELPAGDEEATIQVE